MPSKYDAVLDQLKPLPVADQTYQDKVDQTKLSFASREPKSLAEDYAFLRKEKERIEGQLYTLNMKIEALTQLLEASQEAGDEGWGAYGVAENALRLPTGETVRVQKEPYGYVKDKQVFRLWCLANGYGEQLMLWPTTMNAIVKERLLAGEAPPEGTEAFVKTKVVFVGAKKEK